MIPSLDYTYILKLDIDEPSKYDENKLWEGIKQLELDVDAIDIRPSKSLGLHVYIYLKNPVSIDQVPFFEALLGSDIIRSCLIEWRVRNNSFLDVFFHHVIGINQPIHMSKTTNEVIEFMNCRCRGLLEKLYWHFNYDWEKVYRFIRDAISEY